MSKKPFDPNSWLHSPQGESATVATPKTSIVSTTPFISEEQKIEQLVSAVESSGTDIAPDYASWRDMGFSLADALGECGRSYYQRLSRFYPKYDEKETDKQFSACLNAHGHGITIKTLFHLAKEAGITIYDTFSSEKNYSKSPKSPKSPRGEIGEIGEMEEIELPKQADEPMPTFSQEIYSFLPGLLTQVINKAKNFEDADLLILGSLVSLSACLPNVSGKYAERQVFPNLFLFVSAQASAGKGRLTLCRHLIKPIHDNLKKLYAEEMKEYKRLQNDYALDKKNNEQPEEPPIKTLLIPANSSSTSVYQMLNDNGGVGLIFETEGDTLANTFKSDYGNFSDGFRKAFHHEMISYTRRKDREYVELQRPRLSAVLSGTPRQIFSLIPDTENGLFSRFIFYYMNMRLEWNNVFSDSTETLDEHFEHLGEQFFAFYKILEKSGEIRFALSKPQKEAFNAFFEQSQEEYYDMFGEDIVASVRRLGLITFRIAMILTTLRIMDGMDIAPVIVCNDTDFNTSITMAKVLLKHTKRVFNNLLINDESSSKGNGQPALRQLFFDTLPQDFDRKMYLSIAERLKIPPKTAEKQINKFCEKGLLRHMAHGQYSKS